MAKIGLCIGLNRCENTGREWPRPLDGCVNDALLIGEMLRYAGFDLVRQLHDESATQDAILTRLSNAIARLRGGDHFVFWFSGHGYQVQDYSGDELLDYKDEAVYTYDTDPRDPLIDDKFAMILSRADPEAKVFFGFDTCHSATLSRTYDNSDNQLVAKNWVPPADISFRSGISSLELGDYVGGAKSEENGSKTSPIIRKLGRCSRQGEEAMNHLLLAACQSDNDGYDRYFSEVKRHHGTMTYYFTKAVLESWHKRQTITYKEAFNACQPPLAKYRQEPSLEGKDILKDSPVFGLTF